MKLLTAALVIILLTTISAKPFRSHRLHDADISDSHMRRRWPDGHNRFLRLAESSSYEHSSPESDESAKSSDSSQSNSSDDDSSEEVTDQTPPPVTTDAMTTTAVTTTAVTTTAAITTVTMEDNSTITTEPGTMNTNMPIETTPVTMTPGNVTLCVTKDIPTEPPITENRGDN
ncbi:secretory calcium-binding phosphoprotein 8 [Toxotes jaculatrix]|uniref:secretory calcium-binding phosphoprotein 8 n=1 Tax=Toxotes jaculatrix TaxID=941984 RepID=UPI001B3B13C0|nr:secretory calcium-binding phosphoprotein 8 [Toxotes jaculatrix]